MQLIGASGKNNMRAQAMVEFAVVLPILLLVVYGLLEVGRLIFTYSTVVTAARQAVRYGSANGQVGINPQYKDCNGIFAAAQNVDFLKVITEIQISYAPTVDSPPNFTNTLSSCGGTIPDVHSGGAIRVTVTGLFSPIVPIVPLQPIPIRSSAYRTILSNVRISSDSAPLPPDTVVQSPTISKYFLTNPIQVGSNTILFISISNPNNATPLTGVGFTDTFPTTPTYPSNMVLASNPSTSQCNGTVYGIAGDGYIRLSGGSIPPRTTCTVSAIVTVPKAGIYQNSTTVSWSDGTGNTASDSLQVGDDKVVLPPSTNKAFVPNSIFEGAYSTLQITITNPNLNAALNGVRFVDELPANMMITGTPYSSCGGTLTWTSTTLTLADGRIGKSSSCIVTARVTAPIGTYTNSVDVITSNGGSGLKASADLKVMQYAFYMTSTKFFSPYTIGVGQTSTLTFYITNLSTTNNLTNIAFTDTFPSEITLSSDPTVSQCNGTVSGSAGSNSFSFSGGSIPMGLFNTCTISVTVTSNIAGTFTNPGGTVTASTGLGITSSNWVAKNLVVSDSTPEPICIVNPVGDPTYNHDTETVVWNVLNTGTASPVIDRLIVFWNGGHLQRVKLDEVIMWSGDRGPTTFSIPGVGRTIVPAAQPHTFAFYYPYPDVIEGSTFTVELLFLTNGCAPITGYLDVP